jgi:hypothetical protein
MGATREVRCINPACGALNRVRRYSVFKKPQCGKCGTPLPESGIVKFLRFVRDPSARGRPYAKAIAIISLIAGASLYFAWDSVSMGLGCSVQPVPPHGLYARYSDYSAAVPLRIESSPGSNYFVKISDAKDDRPVISFFVHGGRDLHARVPIGLFKIKDAAGTRWCGEHNLFGADTTIEAGNEPKAFDYGHSYIYRLIKRREGNFRTKSIARNEF